jgi:peptide-methionine (R)-S-oxide reductase
MLFRRLFAFGFVSYTLSYRAIYRSICTQRNNLLLNPLMAAKKELPKDENGWRTVLNPNQFKVLREKATEPPRYSETTAGELEYELKKNMGTKYPKEGVFNCVACDSPLYYAKTKFDSGCGWPAFYEGVPGAIKEIADADGRRVEILCKNCGSHLGHVFKNEGFPNPTNER